MINIENYISRLTGLLRLRFGSRLLYVGLQGSYLRGEATDSSDIDVMVVIDGLSVSDLDCYRDIIFTLEKPDKACGFICGKTDLENWNPLEICHLINSTKDCYGVLSRLVPSYTEYDIRNFVKISINNLYHEICHRYIHADQNKNTEALPGSYKSVFFILQNLYFLEHGKYIKTKAELIPLLSGVSRSVLENAVKLNGGAGVGLNPLDIVKFTSAYATLIRKTCTVKSNKIVVGRDARISGEMVKNVVVGTLMGIQIA